MVSDLGGEENLSAGQRGLLAVQRANYGVILLISEHLAKEGIHTKKGKVQPVLAILGTYINSFRLNQDKLGFARVARHVDTIESIAAEYGVRKQPDETEAQN